MKLTDRVAIVTGAARGIGRDIALGLAEEGANLVVCDLDTQPLDEVAGEVKAIGRQGIAVGADRTSSVVVAADGPLCFVFVAGICAQVDDASCAEVVDGVQEGIVPEPGICSHRLHG